MIGILIIAHGDLGNSFVQCAGHILGNRPSELMHLSISAGDDPDVIITPMILFAFTLRSFLDNHTSH